MATRDYLWLNISSLPYFRGLLRAVEARFYENLTLPAPTLDVGCGDGHFVATNFTRQLEVGMDISKKSLRLSSKHQSYKFLVQSPAQQIPFADHTFGSVISNSVLEHIPPIQPVLNEISRVLFLHGYFVFCVPNDNFDPNLSIARALDKLGFRKLGTGYRHLFDRIARHVHLDSLETWQKRLEMAGLTIIQHWNYFSPDALSILEWGHYFGLPSWITYAMTGRWVLVPKHWSLFLTERIAARYYSEPPIQPDGVCTFFICRSN